MSFILDALRKSDAERRLGSTPTLGAQGVVQSQTADNQIGPLTLVMSSVLSVGLLVIGWVWFATGVPDPAMLAQAPVEPAPTAAGVDSAVGEPASVERAAPAESAPQQRPAEATASSAASDEARPPVSSQVSPELAAVREFKQQQLQASRAEQAQREQTQQEPPPVKQRPVAETATPIAEAQDEPPATALAEQNSQAADETDETDTTTAAPTAPRTTPIHRYELPEGVRNELPEFNIAVQVYDDDPKARFAIVNGERMFEGDALRGGLVLKEIRRNGLLFTFRKYEFIVGG